MNMWGDIISEPFFVMKNKHVSSCGLPPLITNDEPGKYYSYFKNEHGEQRVYIYDRKSKTAELRGGDVGWEKVFQVKDGHVNNLTLGEGERMWLQVCLENYHCSN